MMRIQRKIEPLKNLCSKMGIGEAQVFTFETYEKGKMVHTRNICPREGIEDPACGIGNGALGAYLVKHYYTKEDKMTIRAEQGNIVDTPSVIEIITVRKKEKIDVVIGGHGKIMRKGIFFIE